MPGELSLTSEPIDDQRALVVVDGEIDIFTASQLKCELDAALESGRTRVVVDLTNVTFLDSAPLAVLVGAEKRLRARRGRLTIVNISPNIAKRFQITGLDRIFTIRSTREAAVEALEAGGGTAA
jgi:anti-sigma B factor antagonist